MLDMPTLIIVPECTGKLHYIQPATIKGGMLLNRMQENKPWLCRFEIKNKIKDVLLMMEKAPLMSSELPCDVILFLSDSCLNLKTTADTIMFEKGGK